MFTPSRWNVNDAVHQHLPRTNNSAEAWHRGFQPLTRFAVLTPCTHAGITKLRRRLSVLRLQRSRCMWKLRHINVRLVSLPRTWSYLLRVRTPRPLSSASVFSILSVHTDKRTGVYVDVRMAPVSSASPPCVVTFFIDTGYAVSIIEEEHFRSLF
ncbi:hypothetical protein HPB47_017310 [Ixodes persulcatus]|uniref:Uncharacterized protein n=1 Tax=Ixodes persulcatus TaxID=34615 RepID=A0AC60R020_IXOPE|nr:hypothetical protein HPB47_017310 [Ixodes persulcatus]